MIAAATAALAAATRLFSGLRKREPEPPPRQHLRYRVRFDGNGRLDGALTMLAAADAETERRSNG